MSRRNLTALTLVFTLACLATAPDLAAQAKETKESKETAKILELARSEMLARKYADAVKSATTYAERPDARRDEGLLLLARALDLVGRHEKALKVLTGLEKAFPKSPCRIRALFARADILVRIKRTKEALVILETQARRVTSPKRRLVMAQVYLKFADAFFKPKDDVKRPDYGKAATFYAKAVAMGLPDDLAADVILKQAKSLTEMRRHPQARDLLKAFRKNHQGHRRDADMALALGQSLLAMSRRQEARRVFRDILRAKPAKDVVVSAAFGVARSYGFPRPSSLVDLELGAAALATVGKRYPGHKDAPKAAFQVGAAYFHRGRYAEARQRLETFLASPAARSGVDEAPLAKELLGRCHFRQKEYDRAITVWKSFLSDHPSHGLWTDVQRRIMDAEYAVGADLYNDKKYEHATRAWEPFLASHPLDGRCRTILLLMGKGEHERKRFDRAVAQWEKLVSKYPRSNEASEGLYRIGLTYEKDLSRFSDALTAYRKLNFGPFARAAAMRVAALIRKELMVRTKRVFRTDEKAGIEVTIRNLEKLEFRAWSVDLEAYFRKMHTARGVEKLDVPLIEPDKTWTWKAPDYEPYREISHTVTLPFDGPGVWAVNITGADLEATTVVIRSDLALIIKSSRLNLLVLAQNLRTGKPVPGVHLLISDGKKIRIEERTGPDGVLLAEPKDLSSFSTLRVLGASEGSWASNTLHIANLPAAQGLARRAFAFTDRPAYRPGDRVHLKAIVREVEKGAYAFTAGRRYGLRVMNSGGGLVHTGEAALGRFGTLDWSFTLPSKAPLGKWRVAITTDFKADFTVSFKVVEYRLPKFNVSVTLDHAVCYRGEMVKGMIRVTTFYGAPAPGLEVFYGLGDNLPRQGRTNERGEIPFAFDTREFGESQVVLLQARVPAEDADGTANVYIATTSFRAKVKTLRDVYLVGEGFDVRLLTSDMAGDPVSVKLEVSVLRVEKSGGRVSEVPVAKYQRTTDRKKGAAILTLRIPRSGTHRIRVRGTDRFDNIVEAQREVFVSGEDDEIRVRILSDREEYYLGERPHVDVVNRLSERLGLLTFEGDRIFRYRVVELKKGTNPLPIVMDKTLAPNFLLSVATLDGSRLHQATREFRVTRRLTVKVRPLDENPVPGKPVKIEITTLDPSGRPVPAEVALALVDRAFLAIFPRPLPNPAKVFFTRRGQGCGTVSTNTFSHKAQTRKVLAALRAEENRLEAEKRTLEEVSRLKEKLVARSRRWAPSKKNGKDKRKRGRMEDAKSKDGAPCEEMEDSIESDKDAPMFSGGQAGAFGGRMARRFQKNLSAVRVLSALGASEILEAIQAGSLETGYWNPSIVTDEEGRAVVEVTLPLAVTTWQLLALGATEALLVGAGEGSLTAKKDLVAEIKAPLSMVDGDIAQIRGRVRNLTGQDAKITLSLIALLAESKHKLGERVVTLRPGTEAEEVFSLRSQWGAGDILLVLVAKTKGASDTAQEKVVCLPRGTEIRRGFGGVGTRSQTVRVEVPAGAYASRTLAISLSASLSLSLLEIGDTPAVRRLWGCRPSVIFSPADRGLLALAKRDFVKATRAPSQPKWMRLTGQVEASLADLAVIQKSDGGFGWTPRGRSNIYATCQAVRFLAHARARGFSFNPLLLSRSGAYLTRAFSKAGDNTAKAAALRALAETNRATFSFINRLYRIREGLDNWALASLALTLVRMDRSDMAKEVARLVEKRLAAMPGQVVSDKKKGSWLNRWVDSDRSEETALGLLALCRALPASPGISAAVDSLMGMRVGTVWPTGKATAAAAEALGAYLTAVKSGTERFKLTVKVNDKVVGIFPMDAASGRQTVEVGADGFTAGRNTVSFGMEGTGRYAWRVEFFGLTQEPDLSQKNRYVSIKKIVRPQPIKVSGKDVRPGFNSVVLEGKRQWINRLGQLPEGRYGIVDITFHSRSGEGYLVLEESIPGGAVLEEESLAGDFDHVEVHPDRMLFFLREGRSYGRIHYRFYGYLPGDYQVRPTRIWSAVEPTRLSTGEARTLKVLPAGSPSGDTFKPTPDEILAVGRDRFKAGDFEAAALSLGPLFSGYRLRARVFGDVARMLLFCAVENGRTADIVKFFEILKERGGSVEIPFDKTLIIAKAYRDLGEDELALWVYEGILEASFLQEANVAADLEDQGRGPDAVRFMEDLLREYPDLPVLVSGRFALSQSIYRMSASTRTSVERVRAIARAAEMLRGFLGYFPHHALSDEAGFSLANAYLDLKAPKQAARLAETLAAIHERSPYLDDFNYIAALAHFRARAYEKAVSFAEKVATGRFPANDGTLTKSPKRHLAVYILGQIHHARGEFSKAATYYEKVKNRFPDARAALEQFKWRRLSLPEVTRFRTGKAVTIEVTYRNVDKLGILVYPVDLMKLYLIRRNLKDVASINLAGIHPFHGAKKELGAKARYRDQNATVTLPLKKEGAYLVVVKGGGIEASGLVVLSDLKLEVQEDPASGRIRITVHNEKTDGFEADSHVKVVAALGAEFHSGDTDLRGVYETGGLVGEATVIVKKDTSYAFFRGTAVHRPAVAARRRSPWKSKPSPSMGKAAQQLSLGGQSDKVLQEALGASNDSMQGKNLKGLRSLTRNKQKGMRAGQAKR
jgi:uncharacterized protein YfaS (alpha-2-macroglobulin family)/TolA-binding protein